MEGCGERAGRMDSRAVRRFFVEGCRAVYGEVRRVGRWSEQLSMAHRTCHNAAAYVHRIEADCLGAALRDGSGRLQISYQRKDGWRPDTRAGLDGLSGACAVPGI